MASVVEQVLKARLSDEGPAASKVQLLERSASLDHPSFENLQLGEWVEGEAAILFLDMRKFTRLSMAYADDRAKTATVVNAVVSAAAAGLMDYGAHINDFTGDGIMAVFGGDGGDMFNTHGDALHGASSLMADLRIALNSELQSQGIQDRVQVAIGLVSGPVRWQHIGVENAHRIQAIGEVAPLAAKYASERTRGRR